MSLARSSLSKGVIEMIRQVEKPVKRPVGKKDQKYVRGGITRPFDRAYFSIIAGAIVVLFSSIGFAVSTGMASKDWHGSPAVERRSDQRKDYVTDNHSKVDRVDGPQRVIVGQPISQEQFIDLLLKVGYLDGKDTVEFTTGNFVSSEKRVKVCTSKFARTDDLPPCLIVRFNNNKVTSIEDLETGHKLKVLMLPGESQMDDINNHSPLARPAAEF